MNILRLQTNREESWCAQSLSAWTFRSLSLETGQVVDRYYWFNETAGLACADGQHLTLIGQEQDESTRNFEWIVFEASPAGHAKTGATIAGPGFLR